MTPARWEEVKQVLHEAWEREPGDRPAFLDQACTDDPELRSEVEALLASDEHIGDFLPAPDTAATLEESSDVSGPLPDQRVGAYRLLREIGKGGMGTVFLAERADGQYRKQVAVKLINAQFAAGDLVRRFLNERQVLATLDHPHIAKLLDGGATGNGTPYLVMEYIEGARIDHWCDGRQLPVRDRLVLFQKVCSAVQYAHEQQVIHRDLKPANVLVTPDGTPKLLDFGISKALNPERSTGDAETTTGLAPMTPEHASPEQVRGEAAREPSDIYSLGVLLYHLLTGQSPYPVQRQDIAQMARAICEYEPVRPSAAAPAGLLSKDLDNIVLKALRKEPGRRYGSVQELSDDLDRFLTDLPVRARKESVTYRGRKFLKRNRVLVLAAAFSTVMLLVLVGGLSRFGASNARKPASKGAPSRWDHLKFEKIATLGDPAPAGGIFTNDFEPNAVYPNGDLLFVSENAARDGEGVFLKKNGGGIIPIVFPGWPAPGGGIFTEGVLASVFINDSGDAVFAFGLKPWSPPELKGYNKAGVYRYSHSDGKLTAVVVPGITVAPGFGPIQSTPGRASVNNSGEIAFTALIRTRTGVAPSTGLGQGIFLLDRNAQVTKVAAPGDPAPSGGVFDLLANPWINDRGDIAFVGHLRGQECTNERDVRSCPMSVFLKRTGEAVKCLARPGTPSVDTLLRYAWAPMLNSRGDVVFMGELEARSGIARTRTNSGLFIHSFDIDRPIAVPGDIMPDGRKIATVNASRSNRGYSFNNRGDVIFSATLENGDSGMYAHSNGSFQTILVTDTVIPNIGTVSGIPNSSIEEVLNDRGQIFFSTQLADGKTVLVLASPSN